MSKSQALLLLHYFSSSENFCNLPPCSISSALFLILKTLLVDANNLFRTLDLCAALHIIFFNHCYSLDLQAWTGDNVCHAEKGLTC